MTEKALRAVTDAGGHYPVQVKKEDGTIAFLAENIPSMGYRCYTRTNEEQEKCGCKYNGTDQMRFENPWYEICMDLDGEITSLKEKATGREILKDGKNGNHLLLLEDIPVEWGSAWETTVKRDDKPSLPFKTVELEVPENNGLYTVVHIEKDVHHSHISQDIIVYQHKPFIEFKTEVDWDERQKMLRVEFPVQINALNARYDVAFGNAEHPNHATTSYDQARFEVCGHKWGDVSDGGMGVALLNDCKYGYSIQNSQYGAQFTAQLRSSGR